MDERISIAVMVRQHGNRGGLAGWLCATGRWGPCLHTDIPRIQSGTGSPPTPFRVRGEEADSNASWRAIVAADSQVTSRRF